MVVWLQYFDPSCSDARLRLRFSRETSMHDNNLSNPRLKMAIRMALTSGGLAATFGAHAQTAPAAAAAAGTDTALQEVVVTGSRISVPNQVSISPVTFV
jgi:hypothetical protein